MGDRPAVDTGLRTSHVSRQVHSPGRLPRGVGRVEYEIISKASLICSSPPRRMSSIRPTRTCSSCSVAVCDRPVRPLTLRHREGPGVLQPRTALETLARGLGGIDENHLAELAT